MLRALIMSGGGAKGAFTVGALKQLDTTPGQLAFDVVAGTSIGAVIAPFVTLNDIARAEQLFTTLKTGDVVKRLGRVLQMYNNAYVFNSKGLRKRLNKTFSTQEAQAIIDHPTTTTYFATVCLQTGRVTHFHAGKKQPKPKPPSASYDLIPIKTPKELMNAIMASANQPVLMGPAVVQNGRQYVDGGVRAYAPFEVALDQGVDALWAVLLSPPPKARAVVTKRYGTLVSMLVRTIGLLISDVGDNDLTIATMRMQGAGMSVGNILRPLKDIEEAFGIKALSFEPAAMKKLMAHGVAEAKKLGW